ncbi:hypothetical protein QR680_002413 [Steinernema hermaphroditum]|uniref:Uncharacterized protein n=1 Tax=Steinernema hermaphroditum TaxID=289476 RepID=A0AA39H3I3_9BILA|nr:hypothetical protein QR680_002413 [Steinernema hermaphroditum]
MLYTHVVDLLDQLTVGLIHGHGHGHGLDRSWSRWESLKNSLFIPSSRAKATRSVGQYRYVAVWKTRSIARRRFRPLLSDRRCGNKSLSYCSDILKISTPEGKAIEVERSLVTEFPVVRPSTLHFKRPFLTERVTILNVVAKLSRVGEITQFLNETIRPHLPTWHQFVCYKPCTRCVLTTVEPDTDKKSPDIQPLKLLREYRLASKGKSRQEFKQSPIFELT